MGPRETPQSGVHRHTPGVHSHHRHHQHHAQSADKYATPQPTGVQTRAKTAPTLNEIRATAAKYPLFDTKWNPWDPNLKPDRYAHTTPDDPYFSPEQVKARYEGWITSGEQHPFGNNYSGPASEFEARQLGEDGNFYEFMMARAGLKPVGTYPWNTPIDLADTAGYHHDAVYSMKDTTDDESVKADEEMIEFLDKTPSRDIGEATRKWLTRSAMSFKVKYLPKGSFLGEKLPKIDPLTATEKRTIGGINDSPAGNLKLDQVWGTLLDTFFAVGGEVASIGFSGLMAMAARRLGGRRYTPRDEPLNRFYDRVVHALQTRGITWQSAVSNAIELGGANLINSMLKDFKILSPVSGTISSFGMSKLIVYLMDEFTNWVDDSYKSNLWQSRNLVSREEVQDLIGKDAIHQVLGSGGIAAEMGLEELSRETRTIASSLKARGSAAIRAKAVLAILGVIRNYNGDGSSPMGVLRDVMLSSRVYRDIIIKSQAGDVNLEQIREIMNRALVIPNIIGFLRKSPKVATILRAGESIRMGDVIRGSSFASLLEMFPIFKGLSNLLKK